MKRIRPCVSIALILALMIAGTACGESFAEWIGEAATATEAPPATEAPAEGEARIGTSPAPTGWTFDEDAALPELTPTPTADPIPDTDISDDGMLRVWLKSLGNPQTIDLTLEGAYAVEGDRGFRFARDTRVTLTQEAGDLWLGVGGLTLNMGPALTLTRHLDGWGEAGGIRIDQAEKPTLYCGDLSVAAGEKGLRVILAIQIEDYLKGVVGYEMSDSFPLEALKAQSVAARTYAMKRKWSAGKKDHDLVDTTADQVFKGYDASFENVAAAVEGTRGMVGLWKGGFASCYYGASNGGQTALAGEMLGDSAADAYLDVRDDPYDLENPRSLESDLTVTARCEGSQKLRDMLEAALRPVMAEAGFAEGEWSFDAIEAIEPVEPRFEGSRLYDGLAFDLRVLVAERPQATPSASPGATPSASPGATPSASPSVSPLASPGATTAAPQATGDMSVAPEPEKWASEPQTHRVVLSVFDDIKDGLSLGLNGADCELISAERAEGIDGSPAFRLVMRRFGHGVGMSQRGAQQMAGGHGMSCVEILKFYYPGMDIARMRWPENALTSLDDAEIDLGASRPRPTPLPTAVPLGEPGEGERIAAINATSLNLRAQPTTASQVVDILERGSRVIVSGEPDAEGWVPVRTGEASGYVKAEYLE